MSIRLKAAPVSGHGLSKPDSPTLNRTDELAAMFYILTSLFGRISRYYMLVKLRFPGTVKFRRCLKTCYIFIYS